MPHSIKARMMCNEIEQELKKLNLELSPKIRESMESINREIFVPITHKQKAYSLDPFPIACKQWISSVLTVAKMTQILAPNGGDNILEIGCGSGYQAMVLSKMFRRVCSIERINTLLLESKERFRKLGVTNILTKLDDGQNGWEQYAPYEYVLFSASISSIPQKIIDQLENNGRIVAPIESSSGQCIKSFIKKNGKLEELATHDKCLFVPVLSGVE